MQQNLTDMVKILPKALDQFKRVAEDMNMNGLNEMEVSVDGTSGKLWLVRSGTPEAQRRKEEKGSILTDDRMIEVNHERFFLARR